MQYAGTGVSDQDNSNFDYSYTVRIIKIRIVLRKLQVLTGPFLADLGIPASRGGAGKSFFIGCFFHSLSSLPSNDSTDGASTTDCGRLFHTSVDRYTNYFLHATQ